MTSSFMRAIVKIRICQVLEVDEQDPRHVKVIFGTSFQDSYEPPAREQSSCYYLVNAQPDIPQYDFDRNLSNVEFYGSRELSKATFMLFRREHWITLTKGPVKKEGMLVGSAFGYVAGIMGLPSEHVYWAMADENARQRSSGSSEVGVRPRAMPGKKRDLAQQSYQHQPVYLDYSDDLPKAADGRGPSDQDSRSSSSSDENETLSDGSEEGELRGKKRQCPDTPNTREC